MINKNHSSTLHPCQQDVILSSVKDKEFSTDFYCSTVVDYWCMDRSHTFKLQDPEFNSWFQ